MWAILTADDDEDDEEEPEKEEFAMKAAEEAEAFVFLRVFFGWTEELREGETEEEEGEAERG